MSAPFALLTLNLRPRQFETIVVLFAEVDNSCLKCVRDSIIMLRLTSTIPKVLIFLALTIVERSLFKIFEH